MILFIIIAIGILIYTLFADNWLIYWIKKDARGYHPVREVLKDIHIWFWYNVGLNVINVFAGLGISFAVMIGLAFACPEETNQWQFNINALEDNMVTEGHFYGRRGHVDGELSYFYSRTLSKGEKIEHIPADKTYVRYSDTERPHVEVHQKRVDIPEWVNRVVWIEWMNGYETDYYVLVVPDGTIMNTGQYEIDMN